MFKLILYQIYYLKLKKHGNKMKLIYILLGFIATVSGSKLSGNYCGNIFGNTIDTTFGRKTFNISASVFGVNAKCLDPKYFLAK